MAIHDVVAPGVALSLAAAVCLAVTSLSVRLGTNEGRSNDALVVVLLTNVVVLVPLALWTAYPTYTITWRAALAFVAAGFAGTLLARVFYYASIERIGASRSEPVKATQPLHATAIAVILLGETVTAPHLLGILLIIGGVAVISVEITNTSVGHLSGVSWNALVLPFAAAFFYGIEPIFASVGFDAGTSVYVGLAVKTVSAAAGFAVYLAWKGVLSLEPLYSSGSRRWYVAAGGANTLFLLSYYAALEVTPVSVVVPILQTSPIFVVLISSVFLQKYERVTPRLMRLTVVVVSGSVLVTLYSS